MENTAAKHKEYLWEASMPDYSNVEIQPPNEAALTPAEGNPSKPG